MLKVALAGLGDISFIHKMAIDGIENVEIVAVCDIDESKKDNYKEARFYTDLSKMLDSEEIDVVHICLPHYLHLEATRLCLGKGVNVFLEKPPGLNLQEAIELSKLEASSDKKVCLCLQNRLNTTTKELVKRLEDKEAGSILGIKAIVPWFRPAEYYSSKPWRGTMSKAGGGLMINQAVHTLDLMQVLCGEVESLSAMMGNLLDYTMEVEDTVIARINFENNIKGFFMGTNANYTNSSVDIEVYCEQGRYILRDSTLSFVDKNQSEKLLARDVIPEGAKFYYGQSHKELITQFYQSVENNTDHYIHAKEGNTSMAMIEAIRYASKEQRLIEMREIL